MERNVSGGGGKIPVIVAAAKKRTLTCLCRQKRVLLCERVTKRSRIEVKVSKSSVTALFDKLEFIWKILLSIHQEISFVHPYETNALHFS